ncbi:hypothetical protein ACFSTC_20970 [Nonomuraea ferruginea]
MVQAYPQRGPAQSLVGGGDEFGQFGGGVAGVGATRLRPRRLGDPARGEG